MNPHLQKIFDFIEQSDALSEEERVSLLKSIKSVENDLMISEFKLERTDKVKRTTAILLEETIEELEQKRKVAEESRTKLRKSLVELEAAQDQLVQQEKLASLGQLTAGIAHEIKNPLNFVNNFSEISIEMIEEVREELSAFSNQQTEDNPLSRGKNDSEAETWAMSDETKSGDQTALDDENLNPPNPPVTPLPRGETILEILNDIEANLRKIHEHGSRADSIVKSMLQHSRGGNGKMEPEDLNMLTKEYINLVFHGMRAGKNPMNVDIQLELEEGIGKVPLIAEDFSRVIVNLCNNAFDAMREKANVKGETADDYHPKLTVKTARGNGQVIVEIEDNGPGIPKEIRNKILQPFFTTKKGTEGTGLGLSITNDIIKAHGGRLDLKSTKGEGTIFVIELPLTGETP